MKTRRDITIFMTILVVLLFPILVQASYKATQYTPLGINSLDKMKPNGEFSIYVLRNGDWQKVGDLTFDKFFRERKIDLSDYLSGTETVKIRLLQKGGGAAHIDSVFLGGMPPAKVKGIQDSLALKKLSQKDYDVIDAYGKNVEVIFSAKGKDKILRLTARVEGQRIGNVPFQFPLRNLFRKMNDHSEFYTYTINSENKSTQPFLKEYSHTGSGHPSGFTYGWVSNDHNNLYVRIDFTPDNTMDGDKDYAKVYVKTKKGLKEFKVSVPEKKWGNPDFIYTDKVTYQHKVYDFRIPFTELGIKNVKDGENLPLAFAAYGTAMPGDYSSDLAYDPSNNRYLAVFQRVGTNDVDIYGQLINCDGTPAGSEFIIFDSNAFLSENATKIAYDSDNHRFLVVWAYNSDIYGQLVDANGSLSGGIITISNAAGFQQSPHVTYDNVNDKYLLVWSDTRNYSITNTDIYGQFVTANGSLDGSNFIIDDNDRSQLAPSVAYDNITQRFLVAWEDGPNNYDIYGRILNANGTPYGNNFVISDAADFQWTPKISYDSTNHRFLVVWGDDRNGALNSDIYGQLVEADRSLNGNNFFISNATNEQGFHEVAYDSTNHRFLVVWRDERNSSMYTDIYGQFINENGSLNGNNFVVADATDIRYDLPQIAYNSNFENFLVLYNTNEGGVYDFALSLIGPPCQKKTTPTIVPTLTEWGMIIFIVLAGLGAVCYLRRQRKVEGDYL